jgi:hypothetical protein
MATDEKRGELLAKIPRETLFSAGGFVLFFLAILIEGLDFFPIPFLDQIIELPLDLIYIFLFKMITGLPLSSCIIPFLIERIPGISDVSPTWLIYLLASIPPFEYLFSPLFRIFNTLFGWLARFFPF